MNSVIFRFYEELNYFLAPENHKIPIHYEFNGKPSVKDVIESFGIPHTEVDLILVNGNSVGFSYKLKNEDMVSVYPVFESMDISGENHLRPRPLRKIRFILDVHLGKLARYLRMLGFDALYRNDLKDSEIVKISVKEKRIILTRDLQILKNKHVTHGYYIRNQRPSLQLNEVVRRFDLPRLVSPFTRCMNCNDRIVRVDKKKIISLVPADTLNYYDEFFQCRGCKTFYWEGSHYEKMKKLITRVVEMNK